MIRLALATALILVPVLVAPARADDASRTQSITKANANFRIDGSTIYYDTEADGASGEITDADVDAYVDLLKANRDITLLVVNSSGGSVWAGDEMARITVDFGLDTRVEGECSSSCVQLFLGGASRTMERGSKIGLHSRSWSPASVENYYNDVRDDFGWTTPWDFASWIYSDTQSEVFNSLKYILSRGVSPAFAIEMHAPREKVWFPQRSELLENGVLTE
jgi:hypothetical protein